MSMRGHISYSTAVLVITCGCIVALAQEQRPAPSCGGEEIARASVSRVGDGRTFTLADGREVRLVGIEVPPLPVAQETDAAPGGAAANAALDALAGGDDVVLRGGAPATDRYGRLLAYAYTERDGDEIFVQGELVAAGFARVGDRVGGPACAAELHRREQAARQARLGLWANPYYAVLDAGTPAAVLAQKGRFALVEGRIESVRESGATIYLNFGRHWSEDFTVTVLKRNERNFAAAGLDLKSLAGRRVRVRGFIEERGNLGGEARGSPRIEAERPEQIETANEASRK
jgi:endonuclease YncB( thermonuclease family)